MGLVKQRQLWIGLVAVFVVLIVFGVAMMGSVLGAKPKDLPVALVVLDQPAALPDGSEFAVGAMVREKLLANAQLPIDWALVGSEAEAREGLDKQRYYGALVLPADMSSGLLSLAGPEPKPAAVKIIISEGANTQAAAAVKQMLGQAVRMMGLELSNQLLARFGAQDGNVPVTAAQALLAPIAAQEETVHPVGANNASGNAPGMLVQIVWIGALVVSMILFLTGQKAAGARTRRFETVLVQSVIGLLTMTAVSGFLVWMASSWYGMEFADAGATWFMLWLAGSAFFLLQSALLNWIGLPAMAILVLLMFFSMPVVNMAPEFLPQASRDWLYAWTPFRFAASGLRDTMYFGGAAAVNAGVLWGLAGACLVLLLASAVRKGKGSATSAAAAR